MDDSALTSAQTRLWFLHQLDPTDASYHLPDAWYVRGPLNVAALRRAMAALVARHPILNSRFVAIDGVPVRLPALDEPRLHEVLQEVETTGIEQAAALSDELADRPFDLATGPMIRATLLRLSDDDHLLNIVMHHIAADGWSMQIVRRELAALYEAFDRGTSSVLTALPMAYADHVRRIAETPRDPAALTYWRGALAGVPPLELPTDRPRPPVRAGGGDSYQFDLPRDLFDRLGELARAERCTPFTVLLTAYQVLLSRHSGQYDFAIGVPVLGRDAPMTEGLVGYFAETLVLRGDLTGDPTFRALLRANWGRLLAGFARGAVPFEDILADTETGQRDRSRTPLFQAMLMHLRQDSDRPRFGSLDVEPAGDQRRYAKTDLELDIVESPDRVDGHLTYDRALFTGATIERLARHLLVLLTDALERPGARLSELRIIDDAERADLVGRWNRTAIAEPPGLAPDLFAARVLATPDAVALTYDGHAQTYRELDAEVGRVAALLAGRGPLIGVSLHRGPEMVAALLGVWRSGAAYLPLDPDYPAERIAMIVEDSGADAVLTSRDLADRFGDRSVLIDAAPTSPVPEVRRSGDDIAYVLYTSGSTGRPKGVAVPHRALAAFLHAMAAILGPQESRSWLALTSLSFDISGLELYLPLTRGGRVVIAGDEEARDGAALVRLIRDSGVTDVQATPSGWRMLLEWGFMSSAVDGLVGGEALPLPLATELRGRVHRLINVYGPTETTIWSAYWVVPPKPRDVSIGGPIAGTRLYVVDAHGGLAPIGVPGELCIAGDGVAHGYLGRPSLTAERFVPDPHGPPGSRLYRTGDRVRRLADGRIEYLGRTDNQIKLRGHRIELGEIEAVIAAHPAVRAVAVAVRAETLVAYVETDTSPDDVLQGARAALPSYMVPGSVVVLDALPLTPNGKVDRAALPTIDRLRTQEYVAPRTPGEQRVAEVFAQVLGVERVGAYDDFFALGGHSLLATKVLARLDEPGAIRDLFDHPTVAGFSERLRAADRPAAMNPTTAPDGPVIPSPAQRRLWYLQRLDAADTSYNMFQILRLRGKLDPVALDRALADVVERHDMLRTRYPEVNGEPGVEPVVDRPRIETLDATENPTEAHLDRLVAARANVVFDLTAAAPLRVTLIRIADDEHVLCLVLHHIAGDGWSLNVLRDDLAAHYAARCRGDEPDLPPVAQFVDVAHQHELLERDERAFDYWRERLADPTALALPTDRERPDEPTHRAEFHRFRIDADVATKIDRLAAENRATAYTVMLAAYVLLVSRRSGQRDVLVGSVFAGRDRAEYERMIGYFAATVVLRTDLTGDLTVADLIERTRATVLGAMAHPLIPYERVRAAIDPPRTHTRMHGETPLFRTMFIHHTQDLGAPEAFAHAFPDLDAEFVDARLEQAKFDLMLESWRDPAGFALHIGYDTDLFDAATIAGLADQYAHLCAELVADADRPLSTIS